MRWIVVVGLWLGLGVSSAGEPGAPRVRTNTDTGSEVVVVDTGVDSADTGAPER
jgi:hypothetical protein